ncbi:MAG: hypothetical protein NDF52_01625 [archaeon YNP-WB-062]|nr:hypothetical protein [Candidatus Culexarchaeum yellowstonense]
MKDKLLIAMLFVIILPIAIAQNDQSHPLSQIKPIDTNLDMFKFNITNVTFVGINLTNPQYALDIAGDVRWSGTLRGGIVPWNLINGYNLSVNWVGKLGWGNLTNYPYIITQAGSGLNISTQSLANNITLGVNFTEVQRRVTGSCSGSNAIRVINADGSVDCVDINLYGNVTGTGISGYIPLWQTSSSLNNSLINQTNGNIWITSGNLSILLGGLQIGGISVITSGRSIINVYDVNATRFFQNGVQVIDTLNAGPGISITGSGNSRTISNTGVLSLTAGSGISLNASTGNILINNTGILGINVNAPLTSTGGQTPTLGFNYNGTAFSIVNNALTLADAYFTGAAYDSRFVNEEQANSITTNMIVDGAITNPKIALNAVNYSQIRQVSCPAGQALRVIGGGTYECADVNPTGTITGSGSIGYIPLWNGTYSLNNSIIYQSGGKIGIGTTSPAQQLHVEGNVYISGNLGLGRSNPSYKLDVVGSGKSIINVESPLSSSQAGIRFYRTGESDDAYIYIENYTASNNHRLVLESADDGDSDYIVLRNFHWQQGPIDVLEVRRTYIVSNATLQPGINNLYNLGTSSLQWANIYGIKIYQNNNQVIDTITANAPLSSSKSGGSVSISLNTPLALDYGGTGANLSGAGNYIIVKSGGSLTASPVDLASGNFTGVLPASKGGTGIAGAGGVANRVLVTTDGSTWQAGLVNLANMVTGILPVSSGGTGASDSNTARTNLNAAMAGTCPSGYAVQNATTGGLQCIPVATPSSANVTGAGSPGQIAFWVGSSTLSGDGSLIWDNNAKRLGIGTIPTASLHVAGTLNATSGGGIIYLDADGNIKVGV